MDEITRGLYEACKTLVLAIPNPLHPARMQGQAAIGLADLGHVPRRGLPFPLEVQAATVGAGLDAESLEQAGGVA